MIKKKSSNNPTLYAFYHFFFPDDVAGARHFEDLCQELSKRGWKITVFPSNRSCHSNNLKFQLFEKLNLINIKRIWRPSFKQSSTIGRIINTIWMLLAWSLLPFRKQKADVILVGTDPIFSIFIAIPWKLIPIQKPIIAHWCFDMHPEAEIAEDIISTNSFLSNVLKYCVNLGYNCCDIISDLGPKMRNRLLDYNPKSEYHTIVPWALAEPLNVPQCDPVIRKQFFGESHLGIMYSGNFGIAHSYEDILTLSRLLIQFNKIHFVFGIRGKRLNELRQSILTIDTNISIHPFVPESDLIKKLSAADIHMVSLRCNWSGIVVPSKFFGSLAAGRPVIFSGPSDSDIGRFIERYKVGWILNRSSAQAIANELIELLYSNKKLIDIQNHCFKIYHSFFSKKRMIDYWEEILKRRIE